MIIANSTGELKAFSPHTNLIFSLDYFHEIYYSIRGLITDVESYDRQSPSNFGTLQFYIQKERKRL